MKKWSKSILFCLIVTFSVVVYFELCAFLLIDNQQVRVECCNGDGETDVSGNSDIDADHDDIPGIGTNRTGHSIDFVAIGIIIPHIFFSENASSSVWLPPKLF